MDREEVIEDIKQNIQEGNAPMHLVITDLSYVDREALIALAYAELDRTTH